MTTQHMNYCRQIQRQFQSSGTPLDARDRTAVSLALISQKFSLPDGGVLFDDPSLRAIDETMTLRLPFPNVALEYPCRGGSEVIFAEELGEHIRLNVCTRPRHSDEWFSLMENFLLPRDGYLDRNVAGYLGYPGIVMFDLGRQLDIDDNYTCARVVLSFLNALQCANVRIDRSEPKKKTGKIKAALPFDAYHVLTVALPEGPRNTVGASIGGHRSPREHLRRGHIRRLADGRRIWVNASVVAAGRGAGMVAKDYVVTASVMSL